ncbi:hypothetical protein SLS58_010599 [Diplodia intermedia]|uniref:Uncharacterized protein n=1 Tax=Diplodia intermedia TaxID=856260 RepID=A0ABR3T514_9PEZI
MADPAIMRLDAAPAPVPGRRQDIISAILSDYGDSRDLDDDVELDDYYTQARSPAAAPPVPVPGAAAALPVQSAAASPPAAKDKPLPPLVGFQLRASDILDPGQRVVNSAQPGRDFGDMAMGAV